MKIKSDLKKKYFDQPILITGTFRSGTTLLGNLFEAKVRSCVDNSKSNFWRDAVNGLITEKKGISEIQKAYQDLQNQNDGGEPFYIEKTTLAWHNAKLFHECFPKGKLIIILRDPRDTLASYKYFSNKKKGGVIRGKAYFYLATLFSWVSLVGFLQKKETPFYLVRYEDLVSDSEEELRKIFDYCEIPENLRDLKKPLEVEGNSSFHSFTHPSVQSIGNWQERLTKDEAVFCESVTGSLMSQYGYSTSGSKNSILLDLQFLMKILFSRMTRKNYIRDGKLKRNILLRRGWHLRKKIEILVDYWKVKNDSK